MGQPGVEMAATDREAHWESVYSTKGDAGLSWYQREPRLSLELIQSVTPSPGGRLIDVGGGASTLVDRLLDLPFERMAVLDVSETALGRARARLGERATRVDWIVADITEVQSLPTFDVWHDRAVFHFLTEPMDRRKYIELACQAIHPGGHLIIATFTADGPRRCSDLDVCCYNAETMGAELGEGFSLIREARESHTTPWGSSQAFFYGVFERR
jgi:2-polyprenyl-3-methyl-5-hydroxy-6-metoxy-1,4-benzoquinol methylase